MSKKVLAIAALAVGVAVLGWWALAGKGCGENGDEVCLWMSFETPVKVEKVDDFGEKRVLIEWKKEFKPGLLDLALPIDGGLTALAGLLFFLHAREQKKGA
jgi:hypothetical protein